MKQGEKLVLDKSDWTPVTFGDVVQEPKESVKNAAAAGIERVVGLEHIDSENVHLRRFAGIEESTTFTKKFSKGDVLFGRRRAYLKKAAQAEFEGICSGDITVMRAKKDLLPELLPFIVQNEKFFDYAIEHSAGGLSPRVKFKDLANYEFLLPPKEQQGKFAELLWAMDEVVEKELDLYNYMDTLLKSTLKNKVSIVPSKEGEEVKLENLVNIKHGFAFKSEFWADDDSESPIVVTIGNYDYAGGFRFESTKIKCYSGDYPDDYILNPGDLLLAMTCQTPGGEILGIPGIIADNGRKYLHNQRIGKVEIKNGDYELPKYLYLVFLTSDFRKFICASASGTKVLHTSPGKIMKYKFKLPSLRYRRLVIEEVDHMLKSMKAIKLKKQKSIFMQQGLINQIF